MSRLTLTGTVIFTFFEILFLCWGDSYVGAGNAIVQDDVVHWTVLHKTKLYFVLVLIVLLQVKLDQEFVSLIIDNFSIFFCKYTRMRDGAARPLCSNGRERWHV